MALAEASLARLARMYLSAQQIMVHLGLGLRKNDSQRDELVYYQLGDAEGRAVIAQQGFIPVRSGVQVCSKLRSAEFTEHQPGDGLTVSLATDVATVTWDVTGPELATLRKHSPVGVLMDRERIAGLTIEFFKRLRTSVHDVRNTKARGSASSREDAYKLVTLFKGSKESDTGNNGLYILGLLLNNGPIGYKNFWNPHTLEESACELVYKIIITQ